MVRGLWLCSSQAPQRVLCCSRLTPATHLSSSQGASLTLTVLYFPAVAFRAYDTDGDGFVSEAELEAGMRRMVGAGMADDQLAAIAAHTLAEHDLDGDGRLSLAEFRNLVSPTMADASNAALAVH